MPVDAMVCRNVASLRDAEEGLGDARYAERPLHGAVAGTIATQQGLIIRTIPVWYYACIRTITTLRGCAAGVLLIYRIRNPQAQDPVRVPHLHLVLKAEVEVEGMVLVDVIDNPGGGAQLVDDVVAGLVEPPPELL